MNAGDTGGTGADGEGFDDEKQDRKEGAGSLNKPAPRPAVSAESPAEAQERAFEAARAANEPVPEMGGQETNDNDDDDPDDHVFQPAYVPRQIRRE